VIGRHVPSTAAARATAPAARTVRLGAAYSTPATGHPDWREMAVCASADPEVFWPAKGEVPRAALALCIRCPVVGDCREAFPRSLLPDTGGVWFATTQRERFRHRRLQRAGEAVA